MADGSKLNRNGRRSSRPLPQGFAEMTPPEKCRYGISEEVCPWCCMDSSVASGCRSCEARSSAGEQASDAATPHTVLQSWVRRAYRRHSNASRDTYHLAPFTSSWLEIAIRPVDSSHRQRTIISCLPCSALQLRMLLWINRTWPFRVDSLCHFSALSFSALAQFQ